MGQRELHGPLHLARTWRLWRPLLCKEGSANLLKIGWTPNGHSERWSGLKSAAAVEEMVKDIQALFIKYSEILKAIKLLSYRPKNRRVWRAHTRPSSFLSLMMGVGRTFELPSWNVEYTTSHAARSKTLWLKKVLYKLTLTGGEKLRAGAPKDIVRVAKVSMWVPKPLHRAEVASVLRLVKTQNAGLVLDEWKMIFRKMEDTCHTIIFRSRENLSRSPGYLDVTRGSMHGLASSAGTLFYDKSTAGPRTCILDRKGFAALALTEFCSRDLTALTALLKPGQ